MGGGGECVGEGLKQLGPVLCPFDDRVTFEPGICVFITTHMTFVLF